MDAAIEMGDIKVETVTVTHATPAPVLTCCTQDSNILNASLMATYRAQTAATNTPSAAPVAAESSPAPPPRTPQAAPASAVHSAAPSPVAPQSEKKKEKAEEAKAERPERTEKSAKLARRSKGSSSSGSAESGFASTERPTLRYSDMGGIEHVLQDVRELIEGPLLHPEIFLTLGIEAPRGILFHGPPGCGKTALASAIAGEVGVPFLRISAPEIVSGAWTLCRLLESP